MDDLLRDAHAIITTEELCDRCLGRCFAKRGTRLTNPERGQALRVALAMIEDEAPVSPEECPICQGLFRSVDAWADRAVEAVQDVEFETYLVGTHVPRPVEQAEDALWRRHGLTRERAEPIKQEFNREVGRSFERRLAARGCDVTVDFNEPQVVCFVDSPHDDLQLTIHSLFVYGRYRKLARGIPQTRWPCKRCRGRGCRHCNHTGRQYVESVEELIAQPILWAARGEGHALHGAGREDIDARMLGEGRPFVLEVYAPRVRTLDLDTLRTEINAQAAEKIEVHRLANATRHTVREVKELDARKRYRAWVELSEPISAARLMAAVGSLVNAAVSQRTPTRVSHRRSDLVRQRRVHELSGELTGERTAVVELLGDGGLYVKEFISGDDGRSIPSLAEALGVGARVTALDVLEVEAEVSVEAAR